MSIKPHAHSGLYIMFYNMCISCFFKKHLKVAGWHACLVFCAASSVCTCQWCWWLVSLCVSSLMEYLAPSCLRSCQTWTVCWNCAPTSLLCGRLVRWNWRSNCLRNLSSYIDHLKPWSKWLGKRKQTNASLSHFSAYSFEKNIAPEF